ncbi:Hypp6352 [Branchiostoma lanceolatum]|uniref:Hypp6352 protein n=1 Tax=Branchiostoma lanceolatum TaxID=7740 RepID=A0A8K0E8Q4_BRALA|nr:Hypp6352 [Branchiostoma lanceolatum]
MTRCCRTVCLSACEAAMIDNRTILNILILGTFCTCICAVVPGAWGAALPPEMAGDPAAFTRKQWVQERRNTVGRVVENPCSLPSAVRPPACDWWLVHRYARSPRSHQERDEYHLHAKVVPGFQLPPGSAEARQQPAPHRPEARLLQERSVTFQQREQMWNQLGSLAMRVPVMNEDNATDLSSKHARFEKSKN